jgi:nitrite reductase/ring-hydroxylating ferredoxin subunit
MANWIDVGTLEQYPEGRHVCTHAAGEPIIVCQLDGELYVLRNVCPHAGKPLGEGERRGAVIVCPYHGYAYKLTDGRNADCPEDEPPCRTYPVTTANGRVYVDPTKPKRP